MLRISLAVLHLIALGIGLGAIFARACSAARIPQADTLARTFTADTFWGAAAGLWIITGLWRAIAGTEKTSAYYWSNEVFRAKMALLAVILVLEIWPMMTLIRWRIASRRGTWPAAVDLGRKGRTIAGISIAQMILLVAMVIAATMMARGYGAR